MTGKKIQYRGTTKSGTARIGRAEVEDVPTFVKERFDRGWRRLYVTAENGEQIGGILPSPMGHRTWWWRR